MRYITLQVPQIAPNHTIEHLNFKNFLGKVPPDPPIWWRPMGNQRVAFGKQTVSNFNRNILRRPSLTMDLHRIWHKTHLSKPKMKLYKNLNLFSLCLCYREICLSRRETVRLNWKPGVSRQNRETWEVCYCVTHVVKWTIIGQMAIAITLHGFNDLGCLVTPFFRLMGHFLY